MNWLHRTGITHLLIAIVLLRLGGPSSLMIVGPVDGRQWAVLGGLHTPGFTAHLFGGARAFSFVGAVGGRGPAGASRRSGWANTLVAVLGWRPLLSMLLSWT
jgi:hypothetical protein